MTISLLSNRAKPGRSLKIVCIIPSLSVGGAERIAATFATGWAKAGSAVSMVTFEGGSEDFYALNPAIQRVRLDLAGNSPNWSVALGANLQRVFALGRTIAEARPDVVISFMDTTTILCVLATLRLGVPVIGFESSDPMNSEKRRSLPWRILRRLAYARAAAITVLAPSICDGLAKWRPRVRLALIPNPVPAQLLALPEVPQPPDTGRKRLSTLGRLSRPKGLDMLLTAFAPLAARFPDWDLWMWGEGEERLALEQQIHELRLEGRVFLPGATRTPWEKIARTSLFVLPSRREGFPGALVEAMALGRAAVAFDCMSGPREISRDGQDAALVPPNDVPALSAALAELMADPAKRKELGQRARAVRDRYDPVAISRMWDDLIGSVLAAGKPRSTLQTPPIGSAAPLEPQR